MRLGDSSEVQISYNDDATLRWRNYTNRPSGVLTGPGQFIRKNDMMSTTDGNALALLTGGPWFTVN